MLHNTNMATLAIAWLRLLGVLAVAGTRRTAAAGAEVLEAVPSVDQTRWPDYTTIAPGYSMSYGNHRFNVSVPATPRATVLVTAVWRRSDASALSKAVFITGADHKPIECQHVGVATTDAATFAFAPAPGGGEFFIYYMH